VPIELPGASAYVRDGIITELLRIHPIAPSHFDNPLSGRGTD
jgi:hypothetical protein